MNQGEVIEARFCESVSVLVLFYKLGNEINFKNNSVIDLMDAQDVADANGFKGKVKVVEPSELHKRPVIA